MRTTVALVQARPETILDDYRRVLELADLKALGESGGPALVRGENGSCPGFGNPPWQQAGIVRALGLGEDHRAVQGLPRAAGGSSFGADRFPWLLMPVPRLETGWGVRCSVALLGSLYGETPAGTLRPVAFGGLVRALGRARDEADGLGTVVDGVLWGLGGGTLGKGFVQRNVLLAGRDPVAVDAVACRLAGLDPGRIPWLRFCAEKQAGAVAPDRIRVAGHTELLESTFRGEGLLGMPLDGRWSVSRLRDRLWGVLRRPGVLKSYAETPWGRLEARYRGGLIPPENA